MKYTLTFLIVLMSMQSFASRIETTSTTIRTAEDAIAENRKPCLNFKTQDTSEDSADVVYETATCYMRKDHKNIVTSTFMKEMKAYYPGKIISSDTSFNPLVTAQNLRVTSYDLDRILAATLLDLEATEGCKAEAVEKNWGHRVLQKIDHQFIGDVLKYLDGEIRCQ